MAYEGSTQLASGIVQRNGNDFPLVDASAVQVGADEDNRLDDVLNEMQEALDGIGGFIPIPSQADNGKFVTVANGAYSLVELDATATYATFKLTSTLTQPIYFTQSEPRGVTIDWGDGSAQETVDALAAAASHTYEAAGTYVVSLTARRGVSWSPGATIQRVNENNETVTTIYGFLGTFDIRQIKSETMTQHPTLTGFIFGEGATLQNERTFAGATSLQSILIPVGTTAIPAYAFAGCVKLETVTVPQTISVVGEYAFYSCVPFDFVPLVRQLTSIGNYAFAHCSSSAIYMELTTASVGYAAFGWCTGLRRIWMRNSVRTLTVTSSGSEESTVYISPFYECSESLVLYAECAEVNKPSGWDNHFNVYSGSTEVLIVIWQQLTEPTVSIDIIWNAHGRRLIFQDAYGAGEGYAYNAQDEVLTIY